MPRSSWTDLITPHPSWDSSWCKTGLTGIWSQSSLAGHFDFGFSQKNFYWNIHHCFPKWSLLYLWQESYIGSNFQVYDITSRSSTVSVNWCSHLSFLSSLTINQTGSCKYFRPALRRKTSRAVRMATEITSCLASTTGVWPRLSSHPRVRWKCIVKIQPHHLATSHACFLNLSRSYRRP